MTAIRTAREFVAMMVRQHGRKRGLALAGAAVDRSEHWARAIHYGEAQTVPADVAARALRARLTLAEARLAQLDAEAEELRSIIDASRSPVDLDGGSAS
jgi:hypothetical protein